MPEMASLVGRGGGGFSRRMGHLQHLRQSAEQPSSVCFTVFYVFLRKLDVCVNSSLGLLCVPKLNSGTYLRFYNRTKLEQTA